MKPKIIYWFLAFLSLLGLAYGQTTQQPAPQEQTAAIKMIKDFYVGYATNFEKANDSFVRANITPRLITEIMDNDPALRSRYLDMETYKTLQVRYFKGDTFMVSFVWPDGEKISLPMRTSRVNGRFLIDSFARANMTPALVAKLERIGASTISLNPVLRAQGFDIESLKNVNTFEVKHLDGNWYMVRHKPSSFVEETASTR